MTAAHAKLIGRRIAEVRHLTQEEMHNMGWTGNPQPAIVIGLDNGDALIPSRDPEGNGPGALYKIVAATSDVEIL